MQEWHPQALRVEPLNAKGGTMVDGYPWRQVVHTVEGGRYVPDRSSYYGHQHWPTATIAYVRGIPMLCQHYPLSVSARALENRAGGIETNRARVAQVEVGWWADRIADLPADLAAVLADWLRWVRRQTGHGPLLDELRDRDSYVRMRPSEWRGFSGITGHQRVPENAHYDPGALDLRKLLAEPAHPVPPAPAPNPFTREDDVALPVQRQVGVNPAKFDPPGVLFALLPDPKVGGELRWRPVRSAGYLTELIEAGLVSAGVPGHTHSDMPQEVMDSLAPIGSPVPA